jgi:hypothetical protein
MRSGAFIAVKFVGLLVLIVDGKIYRFFYRKESDFLMSSAILMLRWQDCLRQSRFR